MSQLTVLEKETHKAVAELSFEDTCNILVWSGYSDGYTDELDRYPVIISGIPCGFSYAKAWKSERGQVVILDADVILRVSLTQDLSIKDKVEVRGKTYHVDGIQEGITVKVVYLKEIGTNE
jgi:hypothetical protein